jgi:hypothetical protein
MALLAAIRDAVVKSRVATMTLLVGNRRMAKCWRAARGAECDGAIQRKDFFSAGAVVVRTIGAATARLNDIRRALQSAEPAIAVHSATTMEQLVADEIARPRTAVCGDAVHRDGGRGRRDRRLRRVRL